jgi:hypothetical protein
MSIEGRNTVTPHDPDRESCPNCGLWTFKNGKNEDRAQIAAYAATHRPKPVADEPGPIRCIRLGRGTIQGPTIGKIVSLCVRYDGTVPVMAEFSKIRSSLGVVFGRLV